ncbi:MAG TPA: dTDP-4-dehydrorhamnose reductase [Gemmatimonadetes bacterium]|nr:dTDP-4-dehydrorhamnose reductase [Gemmatimonadota bacterium]
MDLLVTGGTGLLGSAVVRAAEERNWKVTAPSHSEMDVVDLESCVRVIKSKAPDCVIHCAAFTEVDKAEMEPERAMRVNRDGSANVARAAVLAGSDIVHISTDYVFDGRAKSPYGTDEPVSPLGVYATSKVAAETAVIEETSGLVSLLIVRTGWLYGGGRRDFVDKVLESGEAGEDLQIVDDQRGCPTWTCNAAESVLDLIDLEMSGIMNVRDAGQTTWCEFARAVLGMAGISSTVEGVSSRSFGAPARRPSYSVLDLADTELALQRKMMPWRKALRLYMSKRS